MTPILRPCGVPAIANHHASPLLPNQACVLSVTRRNRGVPLNVYRFCIVKVPYRGGVSCTRCSRRVQPHYSVLLCCMKAIRGSSHTLVYTQGFLFLRDLQRLEELFSALCPGETSNTSGSRILALVARATRNFSIVRLRKIILDLCTHSGRPASSTLSRKSHSF